MIRKMLYSWFGVIDALHVSYDSGFSDKPTFVFVHGIGSSAAMWQNVVTQLQNMADIRIIGVDLLGFGSSPKPEWVQYSTADHAKALAATLRRRRVGECVIVGHSLGALVAIEYAKRHPHKVDSLFLCSPPLYTVSDAAKWLPSRDAVYQKLYQKTRERQERALALGRLLSTKIRPNRGFMFNEETLPAFMKSLEKSIESQTSMQDLAQVQCPITIFYGKLDPIILSKNIRTVAKQNDRVKVNSVVAGHEIGKNYAKVLISTLHGYINERAMGRRA